MKLIPPRVLYAINNPDETSESILYENKYFIVFKDLRHLDDSFHYTAWIKKDIRSLIEIDKDIIDQIIELRKSLIEKNIIKQHYAFIHFPPNYWRLHIHFVNKNHKFCAPKHEIFYIDDVIKNLKNNLEYYRKNIRIIDNNKIKDHQTWLL